MRRFAAGLNTPSSARYDPAMSFIRFIWNMVNFRNAENRKVQLKEELRAEANLQKELSKAKSGGQDYWLKRDLEEQKREKKSQ